MSEMGEVGVVTVDDQAFFLSAARDVVEATPGFRQAGEASSGEEALALLEEGCDAQLALVDLRMPNMDGFECARRMKATRPELVVVLISIDEPSFEVGSGEFVRKQDFGPAVLREVWARNTQEGTYG